jgi:hypothetical protein
MLKMPFLAAAAPVVAGGSTAATGAATGAAATGAAGLAGKAATAAASPQGQAAIGAATSGLGAMMGGEKRKDQQVAEAQQAAEQAKQGAEIQTGEPMDLAWDFLALLKARRHNQQKAKEKRYKQQGMVKPIASTIKKPVQAKKDYEREFEMMAPSSSKNNFREEEQTDEDRQAEREVKRNIAATKFSGPTVLSNEEQRGMGEAVEMQRQRLAQEAAQVRSEAGRRAHETRRLNEQKRLAQEEADKQRAMRSLQGQPRPSDLTIESQPLVPGHDYLGQTHTISCPDTGEVFLENKQIANPQTHPSVLQRQYEQRVWDEMNNTVQTGHPMDLAWRMLKMLR